jgi:hypothetical protein
MKLVVVVQYIFIPPAILPLPLAVVFLPNAKPVGVEHYFFMIQLPTSISDVLASRIIMLIVIIVREMTFM